MRFGPNQGTFHIDSGFPYNPVGLLFHLLLNMKNYGGYAKCCLGVVRYTSALDCSTCL